MPNVFNLIFGGILFCFLFSVSIAAININTTELVVFFIVVSALFNSNILLAIKNMLLQNRILISLFLFIGFYNTLLSFLAGASEYVFAMIAVKNIVFMMCGGVLGYFICAQQAKHASPSSEKCLQLFFRISYGVFVAQAAFVLLSFLVPEFRDIVTKLSTNRGNIDIDHPFRFRGIHDSGGFVLSSLLGIGFIFGLYFLGLGRKNDFLKIFGLFLLFLSVALVGRTGFILIGIGVFLLFLLWPKYTLKYVMLCIGIGFFSYSTFSLVAPEQFDFFNRVISDYAFEFFINYSEGKGLSTDSSDDLKSMLFIPDSYNILFGSGSFDLDYAGVGRSDSGYMKSLLSGGAVGFLAIYALYFFVMYKIYIECGVSRDFKALIIILFIGFLILEVKGPIFYQNDISRFLWIMYGIVISYNLQKRED